MKPSRIIILLLMLHKFAFAQMDVATDSEWQYYCMIDSISPGVQNEIIVKYNFNTREREYLTATMSGNYTVSGTLIPCFRMTGTRESWIKTHVGVGYNQYKFTGPNSMQNEDKWLVGLRYSEFPGSGNGASINYFKKLIPLAYPYGNTTREADRLEQDLMDWLDCKNIPYWPDSVYAAPGVNGITGTIEAFRFILDEAIYSKNPNDPNDLFFVNTTSLASYTHNTKLPFDIYRKENAAILWGLDYLGNKVSPPIILSSDQRIDDNYWSNRVDDCDRPSGDNECWIVKTDTMFCSYMLHIQPSEAISKIWANGGNLIWDNSITPFDPNASSGNSTVQALSDTLNKYLLNSNAWGIAAVNNTRGSNAGWNIYISHSDIIFDSLQVTSGNKVYKFEKYACRDYHVYDIKRNELGGIVNCINEFGRFAFMPESAIKVPCNEINTVGECQVKNDLFGELIPASTTRIYDLSRLFSITIIFRGSAGVGSFSFWDESGNKTTQANLANYTLTLTSPEKCKYFRSGRVEIVTGSATAQIVIIK